MAEQIEEAKQLRYNAPTWSEHHFWDGYVEAMERLQDQGVTIPPEPWYRER